MKGFRRLAHGCSRTPMPRELPLCAVALLLAWHAYLRLPPTGAWYVCYRKAGVESWQVLPWDATAAIPDARFVDNATKAATFLKIDGNRNGNVTFHLNDTRAMTWAPIEVRWALVSDATFTGPSGSLPSGLSKAVNSNVPPPPSGLRVPPKP